MDYADRHRRAAASSSDDEAQQAFAQFLSDVIAGGRGDTQAGERAYAQAQALQSAANAPAEVHAIAHACQRILEGLRGDDVLRDVPEVVRPLIQQVLEQISAPEQ